MPLPRGLARANRYFINPVARRVAGWAPGFCILTHIGRRSGREYRLPLNVFRSGDTFVFALTYGSNADWVRNVMAAGRCSIRYRRRDYELSNLRFLDEEEGMGHMPAPVRLFLPRIHVTEFLAGDVQTQPT